MPNWIGKTALTTLLVLFPIWVVLSWFYDITSEGFKRTANKNGEISEAHTLAIGKKLNVFILVALSIAVVLLVIDRFRLQKNNSEYTTEMAVNTVVENAIVVLPFRDLSPKGDQEYFADGLAEELLNALSKIPELKVTSRTSAFSFKNQAIDIPAIAQKLRVNYILEGSVRTSDSLIRVTIQLIDTEKDKEVWSKIWDRKLKNIFEVQNSIARAVSADMEISLLDTSLHSTTEVNPEAYRLYLESKFWFRKNSNLKINQARAQELISRSLKIDSTYAPSWILLSSIYKVQASYYIGPFTFDEGLKKARAAVEKALQLNPKEAIGYSILAIIEIEQFWNFEGAKPYLKKALELEPNNPEIIENAASIYLILGDEAGALEANKKSVLLDPVNVNSQYNLGITYYYLGRYEDVVAPMRQSLELEPDQIGAHWILSLNYIKMGKFKEALLEIEQEPDAVIKQHALSMIYWQQNNKNASEKSLQFVIAAEDSGNEHIISQVYAFRGDNDKAFEWLERAYEKRIFELVEMKYDPFLKALDDDPRWEPFLKKMNLIT